MTAINPIYGFIGRSSRANAMLLPQNFNALQNIVQAGIGLGNDDPTKLHMTAYVQQLNRAMVGMPTDERWAWGFGDDSLYARSDNGVACIPVWGMLINRCGWACSYFTGYDFIQNAYSAAQADSAVQRIVFDVDSYGGEVQGCMETTDIIHASRTQKPTLAIANANACSAGFAIGSSAGRMVAMESSNVGSVGVVLVHVDYSGYLKDSGIKVTLLHEGDHKIDGNSYEPLPTDVKASMQAELKKTMNRFVGVVSRNRSMSADAVIATQAAVYDGPEALGIGFVDAVSLPMVALAEFSTELSGSTHSQEHVMTTETKPGAQAPENNQQQAAVAPSAADEKARIKGILGSADAQGRSALAEHLAFETQMSAVEATAILAKSPKAETPKAEANAFAAAMNSSQNPNVGANGSDANSSKPNDVDPTMAMLAAYGVASGRKFD
jgi:signal peptide peptidase SppA